MNESRRNDYSYLYRQPAMRRESKGGTDDLTDQEDNRYLGDIKLIESICTHCDLNDVTANRRLYQTLQKEKRFSTWVGDAFLSGLANRRSNNRHRRTVEKVCKRIAVSFLAMAVVLLLVLLYLQIREAKESAVLDYIRQEKEQLAKAAERESELELSPEEKVLDQYAILHSMYPEVVGWIKIDDTHIDYPVMQDPTGQDYYLTHSFEGKEDAKGAPFVDTQTQIRPLDQNIVIYGHNIKSGSQFGDLDLYLDQEFYLSHPNITFDTLYETGKYRIVAVVKTKVKKGDEEGFRYYWFRGYEDRGEFQQLLDFIEEESIYETGEVIDYGDSTIMLSTCEYTVDNGRLVIIAKRLGEGRKE